MTQEPEPVEPTEPEPDEGEGAGEEEPEQTLEEAAANYGSAELWEQIDKANDSYITRIIKIVGADAPLAGCEHCQGRGFTLGKQPQLPELLAAEDAVVCEKCNGYGQTKTGALEVPTAQPFKPCGGCGGRGWHEKPVPIAQLVPMPVPAPPGVVAGVPQPMGGQWVPGRGFIPYGATEPVIPDTSGVTP